MDVPPSQESLPVAPSNDPSPKRPRVSAGGSKPSWVMNEEVLDAGLSAGAPLATPASQSQLAKKAHAHTIADWPVVDSKRKMLPNLDPEHKKLYIRLPNEAMPTGDEQRRGKHNYSVTGANGVVVQVQMQNKCFRAMNMKDGVKFPLKDAEGVSTKPNVMFSQHATLQAAWAAVLEKLGVAHLDD